MYIITKDRKSKPVSFSSIDNQKIELFSNTAANEFFYGSRMLQVVGKIASLVANRHCECLCDMQGIDFVRFFSTIKKDDLLLCSSSVNRVWGSVMEIGIKVICEDFRTLEKSKSMSAYFTFVCYDENNNTQYLPIAIPQSDEQKRRYLQAEKRRAAKFKSSCSKEI
jgi:acyl-CoA hydrolase